METQVSFMNLAFYKPYKVYGDYASFTYLRCTTTELRSNGDLDTRP